MALTKNQKDEELTPEQIEAKALAEKEAADKLAADKAEADAAAAKKAEEEAAAAKAKQADLDAKAEADAKAKQADLDAQADKERKEREELEIKVAEQRAKDDDAVREAAGKIARKDEFVKVENLTHVDFRQHSTGLVIGEREVKKLLNDGWLRNQITAGMLKLVEEAE